MPVGALTFITHRVTGVPLALGIPFSIYFLDLSLRGALGYAQMKAMPDKVLVKSVMIVLPWALAHRRPIAAPSWSTA